MRLILQLFNLFLRGTALMLGFISAAAGLGCLAGAFSDKLDILTHVAPIWLTCGLAGLVLALASSREGERKALAATALVGIVAILALMAPELFSTLHRAPKPANDAATLKIIQFNVWAGNLAPDATTAWLLKQNPDVLVVEEGGVLAAPVIRAMNKAYPYAVACPGRSGCDTRIYSRWPIVAGRSFHEEGVDLVGAWATLHHPGGDFTVVGNHFVWPIPAGYWQQQSHRLAERVAAFPQDDLIVTGDFNSTPWSWGLRRQDKALGLERRTRAVASWPTGRFSRLAKSPFPILPIDHVYAGRAWKTVRVERGPSLGSDHRPVVVTLAR